METAARLLLTILLVAFAPADNPNPQGQNAGLTSGQTSIHAAKQNDPPTPGQASTPNSVQRTPRLDAAQNSPPNFATPQWQVGSAWTVQTQSRQVQARREPGPVNQAPAVQWRFTVLPMDKIGDSECYHVRATCEQAGRPQPATELWVDRKTQALLRVTTQLPTPAGFQSVTQDFKHQQGNVSPVVGPLSALPIDWPTFSAEPAKAAKEYSYKALSGGQEKSGGIAFEQKVRQATRSVPVSGVKGLLDEHVAKQKSDDNLREVVLDDGHRVVRQLWQPGMPWPSFCDNGVTVAKLTGVTAPSQLESSKN